MAPGLTRSRPDRFSGLELMMAETFNPRQAVKGILEGIAPPRPLFLPIVFSLGARIENLPLRNFLSNPTKISNALRQIRTHLRSDGVTCYFDPLLEAEALGGALDWDAQGQRASLRWPQPGETGDLPDGLRSPDEAAKGGRVPIAVEVIARLKPLVRGQSLLMAGVTGPFTLAALLTQAKDTNGSLDRAPDAAALDLAGEVTAAVARAFVEAGADAIFIREEVLPLLTAETAAQWATRLATTINILRFYEALPVLLLTCQDATSANSSLIAGQKWDCVLCAETHLMPPGKFASFASLGPSRLGVAFPPSIFESDALTSEGVAGPDSAEDLDLHPAVITTAGDVSANADLKRLNELGCRRLGSNEVDSA
ncbi:MAG TPA: uroporphyrinogen decarboxylase family protein [Verrucomicrobiae bacterium]|nr:uroporphyrinogen decarboxylase family protein [Verrucomicrobiae bacterium]